MTGWRIQPEGVVAVLTTVQADATSLGEAVKNLPVDAQEAVVATNSGAIGEAVQSFFELSASPQLSGVSTRITAAMTGASQATQFYVDGDLQMAASTQADQVAAGDGLLPGRLVHGRFAVN
jgi:Family of unknown function (DUF6507)